MKTARKKLKAKLEQSEEKAKLSTFHDILNMMEVRHAKTELALTEIKMLCDKKK